MEWQPRPTRWRLPSLKGGDALMLKVLSCAIFLVAASVLACSSPTPTPTSTAVPVPTSTPAPTPTPAPAPTTTPLPTEAAPKPASGSGAILPLNLEDPQAFLSELSAVEQSCLPENVDLQRLMAPEGGPDLVSPEEAAELIQCLQQETLLRLFLTGLTGQTGPLSGETSACVRSGFADFDLRAIMLATSGESDEAAAMVGSMAGFLVTLSCLNEEEWQAAGPSLGLGPDDREGLECVMDELGGPEGVAAALQPDDAGPPMAFFSAAAACNLQIVEEP